MTSRPIQQWLSTLDLRMGLRRWCTIAVLSLAWCGLWRSISFANLASGVLLSTAILASNLGTRGRGGIKIIPLAHLLWVVFVDLVASTIEVAKEVLTIEDTTNEAIVAVEIGEEARSHFLLLIVAVTLTPGTAVVDADPDTGTLYLHLLHYNQVDDVKAHVRKLADLANAALPVPAAMRTDTATRLKGSTS